MKRALLLCLFLIACGPKNKVYVTPGPPGNDGSPGIPGSPGTPGTPGQDGEDGDDGVSPTLPIDIYDAQYDGVVPTLCGQETFTSDIFNLTSIMAGGGNPGQNGWGSSDNSMVFNESIVSTSDACRGAGVWKVNTNVISGGFGNQTSSPPMAETAGESDLRSANGGDTMETTFFFKSINPLGDGSAIEINMATPTANDRHNALYLINSSDGIGGLKMYAAATTSALSFGYKYFMTRNTWHHVRIININRDGVNLDGTGNDIVRIYIDGVLSLQVSTFEQSRRYGDLNCVAPTFCPGPSYAVNRIMFRIARPSNQAVPAYTSPMGFMFDDFKTKVYNRANPSNIKAIYQTGFEF